MFLGENSERHWNLVGDHWKLKVFGFVFFEARQLWSNCPDLASISHTKVNPTLMREYIYHEDILY